MMATTPMTRITPRQMKLLELLADDRGRFLCVWSPLRSTARRARVCNRGGDLMPYTFAMATVRRMTDRGLLELKRGYCPRNTESHRAGAMTGASNQSWWITDAGVARVAAQKGGG